MSDTNDGVVKAYATKLNIDMDTARERLEDNYKKEVEDVDAKEIALKCIKSIREMSPKLMGVVNREIDTVYKIQQIESTLSQVRIKLQDLQSLQEEVLNLRNELDTQKRVFKKAVQLFQEQQSQPTLMDVIRCNYRRLLNFLKLN